MTTYTYVFIYGYINTTHSNIIFGYLECYCTNVEQQNIWLNQQEPSIHCYYSVSGEANQLTVEGLPNKSE